MPTATDGDQILHDWRVHFDDGIRGPAFATVLLDLSTCTHRTSRTEGLLVHIDT